MSSARVFVVTGGNKGIGKSIVKLLLQDKGEKIVYLTSRNVENGKRAVKDLEDLGLKAHFQQLDITNLKSIETLRDFLVEEHGGLDVLVNNAGIAYIGSSTVPFAEQAEVTNNCNFFGTLQVCDTLFPILKKNARVAHVSSMSSENIFKKLSPELKARFCASDLTIDKLKALIKEFVTAAKEDQVTERGWFKNSYGTSKVGVSFMNIIQQKEFDKTPEKNVLVNCCCPGVVETDMALAGIKFENMQTPDQGADTPTYLALLPIDVKDPKGSFLKLRKVTPYPPQQNKL